MVFSFRVGPLPRQFPDQSNAAGTSPPLNPAGRMIKVIAPHIEHAIVARAKILEGDVGAKFQQLLF